jgi:hypothetical protein
MMQFTVFYSWQSDLAVETNKGLIRGAIKLACNNLENEFQATELRITVDEAADNVSGSPNIPLTIFDKIASADVFICDITTINKEVIEVIEAIRNLQAIEDITKPKKLRPVPNPNVMIELGYAIAHLGWDRIIMLFNTSYGTLEDAPFDIDRHKIHHYKLSPKPENKPKKQFEEDKKTIIKDMAKDIYNNLKLIIEKSPKKPRYKAELTPEEMKRNRDVSTIKTILETIHITSMTNHINEAPKKVYTEIFHFYNSFQGKLTSGNYYLYDDKLKDLVEKVHVTWGKTLHDDYGEHYGFSGGSCLFFEVHDYMPLTEKQQKDWNDIEEALTQLDLVFNEFLNYIRENYLEIDLKETTSTAWRKYENFMNENKTD